VKPITPPFDLFTLFRSRRNPMAAQSSVDPFGASEEPTMPQIAVINESTAIADADVQKMLPAF